MLIINYRPMTGEAVHDGYIDTYVAILLNRLNETDDDFVCNIATELVIHKLRERINAGVINPSDIQFMYNEEIVQHDRNGRFTHWPDGFCNNYGKILEKLIK